jgi:hypothetical protein
MSPLTNRRFDRASGTQALSEKLGRPVNVAEFGMADDVSLASRALTYSPSTSTTVDTIVELGKADVKRRSVIKAPFVLAALAAPSRDWLISTLGETTSDRGLRKVGMRQVAGIREMFAIPGDGCDARRRPRTDRAG